MLFDFVTISDLQYDNYANFDRSIDPETGLTRRLSYCSRALRFVADYCALNKVPYLFIAGDLLDRKKDTPQEVLYYLKKDLEYVQERVKEIHAISGNHDYMDKEGKHSLIRIFSNPDFHVYESSCIKKLDDEVHVAFVPDVASKVADYSRLANEMNTLPGFKILLAHVGINGAAMSTHMISESTVKIHDLHPEAFHLILLGDYHKHQCLIANKCWYIGALLQKNFGFEGDPQHFAHFRIGKTDAGSYQQQVNWVKLPEAHFPQFLTLEPGQQPSSDFLGYIKLKSETPVPLESLRVMETSIQEIPGVLKSFSEVPVKVTEEQPRIQFSGQSSFEEKCFQYLEERCPDYLQKPKVKERLINYIR